MPLSDDQAKDIAAQRAVAVPTRRITVPALEELLYEPIPVLDHGFVRVVDYMGADESVVQAARVSYGKGTRQVSDDRGLIRYLLRNAHSTPFEMCEIKLHVKLPIFVARQWVRHRTANINEYSARYSVLDREFYLPRPEMIGAQDSRNRQGRGNTLSPERARQVLDILKRDAETTYAHYEELLGDPGPEAAGQAGTEDEPLARELARINLPVSFYTQWYWKIDLHNLFHFLRLRSDAHAQYEIRAYGEALVRVMEAWVPLCWEAFTDYRLKALSLSRVEAEIVRRLVRGESAGAGVAELSKREREELAAKLGIDLNRLG